MYFFFAKFVFLCLFGFMFYTPVKSYGHVEPNHTFSWASLTNGLTSTLCTYFHLQMTTTPLNQRKEENGSRNYFMINLDECMGLCPD